MPFAPFHSGVSFPTGQLSVYLGLAVLSVTNHRDPNCSLRGYEPDYLHFGNLSCNIVGTPSRAEVDRASGTHIEHTPKMSGTRHFYGELWGFGPSHGPILT